MSEQHYVFKDGKQHAVVPLAEVERWKAIEAAARAVLRSYDATMGVELAGAGDLRAALGSKP